MITVATRIGHEQKVTKADSALVTIGKELEQVEARLNALAREQEAIQARADQRAADLHIRRSSLATLREQHEQASADASISSGTVAAPSAVNLDSLVRRLRKDEKALVDAEARNTSEAAREQVRLAAIETERQHWQEKATELKHQLEITEQVKARTIRALGEDLYQVVVAQEAMLHKQIEARGQALDAAQVEMDTFAEEALRRLADWPDLREQARTSLASHYHDSTTDIMAAAIRLLTVLIAEGAGAEIDGDLIRSVVPGRSSLSELLQVAEHNLYPAFNGRDPDQLREQCSNLERLLEQYRSVKR